MRGFNLKFPRVVVLCNVRDQLSYTCGPKLNFSDLDCVIKYKRTFSRIQLGSRLGKNKPHPCFSCYEFKFCTG